MLQLLRWEDLKVWLPAPAIHRGLFPWTRLRQCRRLQMVRPVRPQLAIPLILRITRVRVGAEFLMWGRAICCRKERAEWHIWNTTTRSRISTGAAILARR